MYPNRSNDLKLYSIINELKIFTNRYNEVEESTIMREKRDSDIIPAAEINNCV